MWWTKQNLQMFVYDGRKNLMWLWMNIMTCISIEA